MIKGRKTDGDQDYIMIDTCKDGSLTVATRRINFAKKQKTKTLSDNKKKNNIFELQGRLSNEAVFLCAQNIPCDVYLKCDDGAVFSAHKDILSTTSPYFDAMFHSNMVEKVQAIINIQCVTSQALKQVIRYAYSAKNSILLADELYDLVIAANMLCVRDIEAQCLDFLSRNMEIENCLDILTVAEMVCCEDLYMLSLNFMRDNFRQFLRQPTFQYLPPQYLELLLSNDCLDVSSEVDVFDALVLWICHDVHARQTYLPRLLRHVRLMLLSRKYLVDRVLRENVVMGNDEARGIVLEALDCHMLPERTCLPESTCTAGTRSPRQSLNRKIYVIGGQGTSLKK